MSRNICIFSAVYRMESVNLQKLPNTLLILLEIHKNEVKTISLPNNKGKINLLTKGKVS